MSDTIPALVTADVLADAFHVSPQTVYRWASEGVVPSIRVGGSIRFDVLAVAEALTKPRKGTK
jgi:excisionase family DNA binding protein